MRTAVLFDLDGVLVDSEPIQLAVFRECLAEAGLELGAEELERRVVGEGATVAALLAEAGLGERAAAVDAAVLERLLPRLATVRPLPGAAGAVARARAAGHTVALVSSSRRAAVEAKLERCGLAGAFDAIVAREDAARLKPAPDPYLRAAELLGVEPARCAVIEDADKGLLAARAAGMTVVAVGAGASPGLADRAFARLDDVPFEALP